MIDRRQFLGTTLAGGMGVVVGASGCAPGDPGQGGAGGAAGQGDTSSPVPDFELDEVTVEELQASMTSGERTAQAIAELYLERIEALDRQGPELRSVIETNPDALEVAAELDRERAAGNVRGPLHGIPVALKDNIDTHDRMTTTAGSLALEGSIPPQDSFVAQKLREAGVLILAKLNLSEWA